MPRIGPVRRQGDEPTDRLTRLAQTAVDAIEAHLEHRGGEQVIVLIRASADDGPRSENSMAAAGFDDGSEAIDFLLDTCEAMCSASGRSFRVVNLGQN